MAYVCFIVTLAASVLLLQDVSGKTTAPVDCTACVSTIEAFKVLSPEMLETVHNLCDQFTGSDAAICRQTTAEIWKQSPRDVCLLIGQCSDPAGVDSDPLIFNSEMATVDDNITDVPVGGTMVCTICRMAVGFLQRYLSGKHSEKMVMHLLRMVCRFIPFVRSMCIILVNEYGPMLIHLIKAFLRPGICHSWFHCPKITGSEELAENCRMCRFGTGVVYDTIHDPELEKRIKLYTRDFCARSNDYQCASTAMEVSKFLKPLADELKQSTYLKDLCQNINECPAGAKETFDPTTE